MTDSVDIVRFDEQLRNLLSILLPKYLPKYEEIVQKPLEDFKNLVLGRKIQFIGIEGTKFVEERDTIIKIYFKRALLFLSFPEGKQLSNIIYDYFSNHTKPISSPNCENCFSSNLQYMRELDKLVCMNCGLEKNEDSFEPKIKINNYNRFNNVSKLVNDLHFINSSQKTILLEQYNKIQREYNKLNILSRGSRKNFFRAPFVIKFLCEKNNFPLFSAGSSELCSELINCEIKDANLNQRCKETLEKLFLEI